MQLDTTAALGSVAISAGIGFGLAFYIERKINSRMQRKSQKILVSIAMISFGYGLTAFLNEVIGFPLQGLRIRYDKLAVYLVANILILPIVLLVIANSMGLKNKAADVALNVQSNPVAVNSFKYVLLLAGVVSIAYFGYAAFEGISSGATYDVRTCSTEDQLCSTCKKFDDLKLTPKINLQNGDILLNSKSKNKSSSVALSKCKIIDLDNWDCTEPFTSELTSPGVNGSTRFIFTSTNGYKMVDGELQYFPFYSSLSTTINGATTSKRFNDPSYSCFVKNSFFDFQK